MGNCCGKADGNFSGAGRTLDGADSNPPARPFQGSTHGRSAPPQGGRVLGSASTNTNGDAVSPKEAAARAAEARAAAQGTSKGALSQKLNQQRQQTQNATLAQGARDNLASRDADAAAQARNWN